VVAWAAYLVGKKPFTNYIILGDDIVIKDDKVAKKYISIMHKLGVSISEAKTHVSSDTYEFAKR
jgi:UTP-glucose-1-phosphate uridylyltransferase